MWEDKIPTPTAEAIQKQLFFDALKQFTPETISRATNWMIQRHQYPDLSFIVKYAEEFSQSSKIPDFVALEFKPASTPESRQAADEARLKIRQLCRLKR